MLLRYLSRVIPRKSRDHLLLDIPVVHTYNAP